MADNVTVGGYTYATDDIAGVHYQKMKLAYGAADAATLVDTTNRYPVAYTAQTTTTLLASAARTATTTSTIYTNSYYTTAYFFWNITVAGTGTLVVEIRARDPIVTAKFHVLDSQMTITAATGERALHMGAGVAAPSGPNIFGRNAALPQEVYAVVTHSDASSWTYSLSARLGH